MAWYNVAWTKRKPITIDNTKVSGASHTSFPVLVSVTDADIKASAQADGDDILFTLSDGTTKLDHEIEKWDDGTGELVAWVRVPTLSGSVDTDLFVYYGNPVAADQQNPTGVWDSNYKGVWHMGESAGSAEDSTVNNHDGTFNGDLPDSVPAIIANGQDLDGTGDQVSVASAADLNLFNVSWTISCLFKQAADMGSGQYAYFSLGSDNDDILTCYADNKRFRLLIRNSASTVVTIRSDPSPGDWNPSADPHRMDVVRDGNEYYLYVDGVEDSNVTDADQIEDSNQPFYMGFYNAINYYYTGILDEFRISKGIARSANWIATEFANQDEPGTFYSVGAEEGLGSVLERTTGILQRTASAVLVRILSA